MDTSTFISQCCNTTEKYEKEFSNDNMSTVKVTNTYCDRKLETAKSGVFNFETDIIWFTVVQITLLHVIGIYGLLTFNYLENPVTTLWIIGMNVISIFGMSAGVHRFWSHKCYKSKLPLRILLLVCFNICAQRSISSWVKNHRMHHKYSDTNADPHNSKRGFFYSHIGWLMMKEHPEFIKKSQQIDLSDIMSDPVVVFGEKYSLPLQFIFSFILPTVMPVYLWNETWSRAVISQMFIRYMISLHCVWTANSIAHVWGTKPYNKNINPTDNVFVNFITIGEGHHNYHHVFPWDYRSAEKGSNRMNFTTFIIDIFAKLGLAYDLKYASVDLIKSVMSKKGDGTYYMPITEVPRPK